MNKNDMLIIRFFICLLFIGFLGLSNAPANDTIDRQSVDWSLKVIPLPQKIQVNGSVIISRENIVMRAPQKLHPQLSMAKEILKPFARGKNGFELKLVFAGNKKECPLYLRKALGRMKNKDQAYAIAPILKKEKFVGLILAANEPIGLLYAARTLAQLLSYPKPADRIEIPRIEITDWPDLEERGEWGWNLPHDMFGIAALKMNEIEIHAHLGFNKDGSPKATLDESFLRDAFRIGIKVVPIIKHLEQLAKTGLFKYHPKVAAVYEPGKELPTDYEPALCYSNPKSVELVAGWMRGLLAYKQVNDINAWLSESYAPCFCDLCRGKNPVVLQTKLLNLAFNKVKMDFPGSHLRILLTQGSYNDNDKVLSSILPDTRITYYSGDKTYDSSSKPMIYSLLEKFAKAGHWLSVYPQLTNSWRTIFPFTGGQFIHARMNEFVDKNLHGFSGYATPSNCYYDFNIAATAEWSWNSKGRTVREFAMAYATHIGLNNPELFADWADMIGKPGWKIAGSRIVETSVFAAGGQGFVDGVIQDGRLFRKKKSLQFGRGILAEFDDMADLDKQIQLAERALQMARTAQEPVMIYESQCVLGVLKYARSVYDFSKVFGRQTSNMNKAEMARILDQLDGIAEQLTRSIEQWGQSVNPVERELVHHRFRDTVDFASNIVDILRAMSKERGINDPFSQYRFSRVAEWKTRDFADSDSATIWADVTDFIAESGEYDVRILFSDGASGVKAQEVTLLTGAKRDNAMPLFTDRWERRLSRFGRYTEYWIRVPDRPKNIANSLDRYFVRVELKGPAMELPVNRRTSNGQILIRKSWRNGKSIEMQ